MSGTVRPQDIEALVEQFQTSGCAELHVRFEGFELHLSTDAAAGGRLRADASSAKPASAAADRHAASAAPGEPMEGLEIVRAPYQGLFYRAPRPGEAPFVEVGAQVAPDTDLCLIEVMKLFTAVRAGVSGTVVKVLADDGAMVDGGQALFALAPSG
jgi:acetyl-CoA carboxylase biotin carboxyl carrier protein